MTDDELKKLERIVLEVGDMVDAAVADPEVPHDVIVDLKLRLQRLIDQCDTLLNSRKDDH